MVVMFSEMFLARMLGGSDASSFSYPYLSSYPIPGGDYPSFSSAPSSCAFSYSDHYYYYMLLHHCTDVKKYLTVPDSYGRSIETHRWHQSGVNNNNNISSVISRVGSGKG
ncbi:hypothetical protein H5410_049619 [Solanum commersonii]|uniref:Uncharacterized protein n=1 Tax=Solanum commersonii TaxID=4109 RepID=A0A9J5WVI6_SOLCO|nr:hypothetical protein H5410_049619 [Solanum commersonii]